MLWGIHALSPSLLASRHSKVCKMGPNEYPNMAQDTFSKPAPPFSPFPAPPPVATAQHQSSFSYQPQPQSSYPHATDPHMAIELKKERMRLEFMRLEAERREREDRYEREERQRRDREVRRCCSVFWSAQRCKQDQLGACGRQQ